MVGKEYKKKNLRDDIGQFTSEDKIKSMWKMKILVFMLFVIAFGTLLARTILAINDWSEKNVIKTQSPISFHKPVWVEDRPKLIVLSPVIKDYIEPTELDPIDQKILDLWGDRYFILARSIFKCESGLKADAVNWGSRDIGVSQINFPTWEKPILEKFGYTLVDLFDVDKNLEVAYWIWDRADGEEGNNEGSFKAWVVFQNSSFTSCVE
jgi:hypothetical protein